MKLPSINYLVKNAKDALLRFPLSILSSFIAVFIAIYLIENEKEITNFFPFINFMLCMSIGIPLFFCVTIISNKKSFNKKQQLWANLTAVIVLIAVYFTLPSAQSTHNTSLPYIKYAIYNITCHLLVSVIPFAFTRQLNAFWHYNKILFIRFLTSILYSGFIYLGLIIALTSLKLLFDINIHSQLYLEIWVVTICFFNTWFFVGGIPDDFDVLENSYDYPKGLKVFSQYVLLPLIGLYLLILFSYGSKILLTWDWPRGIVSYLIICVSVLGILTFLLLHPYGEQTENAWIKKASKGYYFLLFPLLIIFFIAIFMRINEYGITINRYVILVLGIWLSVVCIYTAIGKTNIKFIPSSLAIMLLIISFGPWGMFSVSEKSQVNRLKHILEESEILVNNKVKQEAIWVKDSLPELYSKNELMNDIKLNDSLHNEVLSILNYLDNHHGFSMIREWYQQDLDSIITTIISKNEDERYFDESKVYMLSLGLKDEFIEIDEEESSIEFVSNRNNIIKEVSGFDYIINFDQYTGEETETEIAEFKIDSVNYSLSYLNKPAVKLVLRSKNETVYFKVDSLISELKKKYNNTAASEIPPSNMQLMDSTNKFNFKIEFQNLDVQPNKNTNSIVRLSGDIFIKKR
jgi:flagellar biosynthesis protein FliQ